MSYTVKISKVIQWKSSGSGLLLCDWGGKVATVLINFSQILTFHTKTETNTFLLLQRTLKTKFVLQILFLKPAAWVGARSRLEHLHNTVCMERGYIVCCVVLPEVGLVSDWLLVCEPVARRRRLAAVFSLSLCLADPCPASIQPYSLQYHTSSYISCL